MFKLNRKLKTTLFVPVSLLFGSLVTSAQSSTTTITTAPGQYSRDTTVTRPNGKAASYQNNASWGNGVYSDNRTYTGSNGKTATENINRSNGQLTKTYTGPNGHSRTYSHPTHGRRWR